MRRDVSAHIELSIAGPARLAFSVGVATNWPVTETLEVQGAEPGHDIAAEHGARLRVIEAERGDLTLHYTATVLGDPEEGEPHHELDLFRYLRPSRYCEADALAPTARAEFAGLTGSSLLAAVSSWVGTRLAYVPGSSLPTDGALRTLLARQGVCRDYAHLVIALLRALDVPARMAAVYAPGLNPMDFHAVAEAYVDGAWHVVDATALAPRSTLVRIATGRDAADTAFLSNYGAFVSLNRLEITAVAESLPFDDMDRMVTLG
ncbi:transglutaminase family protein [Rathayibacter sp. YIM 133350]|uniref:transglutaminase-like domain-containing protein n=1 Tax=Rathayibacter sp. YIM 133350 TaxID=3131992 RepID=UPI00307DDF40